MVAVWRSSRRRAVLFRVTAVILGLLPFGLFELGLRVFGFGQPEWHHDPFVGFSETRPLFVRNDAEGRYEIAPSKRVHFYPESFPIQKPSREFRIFCIGDSTVQGNPWTTETSFTSWLELSLNSADHSRDWNVINCGAVSYASYRMVPILVEMLRYQPDIIIVHCSHNEFLEDRTYDNLKRTPRWLWRLQEQVSRLRLFNVMRSITSKETDTRRTIETANKTQSPAVRGSVPHSEPILSAEVEALLDYRGGLEFYHRDESWHRDVIAHYEFNLRRMTTIARQANVALILMNPACNLRDSPPFKAEHRAGLTVDEQQQWDDLWTNARSHYAEQPGESLNLLRKALAIDNQHAGLRYDLAKVFDSLSQFAEARAEYVQAKELDVCPLRILQPMNDIVQQVGFDTGTPVVDVRALFDRLSRDGIPGNDWFADHVHPTIAGYQCVADEIATLLEQQGVFHPHREWIAERQREYQKHLQTLPPNYFIEGQRRLQSLMLWANGRAAKERFDKNGRVERVIAPHQD